VTAEVQAKLQAVGMEGTSPVKRTINAKVVPLDRDSDLVHVAI